MTPYCLKNGPEKNHQGRLNCKRRLVEPKMFATGTERCPVRVLQTYLSKRPSKCKSSGPLYLAIIDKPKDRCVWYKDSRLGMHSLNNMMKNIIAGTPIESSKKLTNHSARKTVVRKLKSAGYAKSEIKNITGHSRADGLDPYDSGNEEEMRQMSNAIVPSSLPRNMPRSSRITTSSIQSDHFSMGIPWGDSVPSITHGNTYIFQNCKTVNMRAADNISVSPPA